MTGPVQVTVAAPDRWASRPDQLAALLKTSAVVIPDPTGRPAEAQNLAVLTLPAEWARETQVLREALEQTGSPSAGAATRTASRNAGAVAPVEERLVFTVEEAAALLGISRSFAYEAIQRGEVPSMRIGKRILVPKAALERFLAQHGSDTADS